MHVTIPNRWWTGLLALMLVGCVSETVDVVATSPEATASLGPVVPQRIVDLSGNLAVNMTPDVIALVERTQQALLRAHGRVPVVGAVLVEVRLSMDQAPAFEIAVDDPRRNAFIEEVEPFLRGGEAIRAKGEECIFEIHYNAVSNGT